MRISFDIIGNVAVVDIPEEKKRYKEKIVGEIIERHKNVKTVCIKLSERKGKFRLRELEVAYGRSTETVHKEHGCFFKLDVRKVYFSPREATERSRIVKQVRDGENVLVMFAGVGPYAIRIAKERKAKVYAIELNRHAYRYMEENIIMNKVADRVYPVFGDVKEKAKMFFGKMDRVLMPLPKGGYSFLDEAIRCIKGSGGVVHFYHWAREDDLFSEAESLIERECRKAGLNFIIKGKRKVLPYAPRTWKVCVDFEVFKG